MLFFPPRPKPVNPDFNPVIIESQKRQIEDLKRYIRFLEAKTEKPRGRSSEKNNDEYLNSYNPVPNVPRERPTGWF
jgi:hypothetical protein